MTLPQDEEFAISDDERSISPSLAESIHEANDSDSQSGGLLHGWNARDLVPPHTLSGAGGNEYNILVQSATEPLDDDFIEKKVLPLKSDDFHGKLKHFFILSTAGKPIYTLNGTDEAILAYMGLITTVVASYQEKIKSEFVHIRQDGLMLVVLNKSPLLLVAISKIPHECSPATRLLENQLHVLYNYIVVVLSRLVVDRHFHNRLNYDLRKLLSPQDISAMDSLALTLTYGFSSSDTTEKSLVLCDCGLYMATLLDSSVRCAAVRNTTRNKLASIFLAAKKLKTQSQPPRYVADDLLFAILALDDQVISFARPPHHTLTNSDLRALLSTVASLSRPLAFDEGSTELWVPLCMPEFNDSGFMYCYIGKFLLSYLDKPVTLILLSGNKNSFYDMKGVASYIIGRVRRSQKVSQGLATDLTNARLTVPFTPTIKHGTIRHFIYRQKKHNQFYMEDLGAATSESMQKCLFITSLYASLHDSGATTTYVAERHPKKLTYTRWHLKDEWITAFLLSDAKYDFYCLVGGAVQAQDIIKESVGMIHSCMKYSKRITIGEGLVF